MMDTDPKAYCRECRDPVHGFVYLSKAEWEIVDCQTFQRLRDIRQLAMAHLVYPGATHTRFEHSLGCLHLADSIYCALRRQVDQGSCPNFARAFRADEKQVGAGRQLLRLAGLLHDLGHPPFSHSGEKLMPEREVAGRRRRMTHEDMTAKLIRETEIAETLRGHFGDDGVDVVEEVIAVATKPEMASLPEKRDCSWYRFLNDVIAGELGSDRMDYLLRDATHSGQCGGLFDHRKLIDSMTIVPPPEETGHEYQLGLDGTGWLVGEQMVAARYLMYVALYFHKTKRIYEIHLERFLESWLEETYGEPYLPVDAPLKYAALTDSAVWAAIYAAGQQSGNLSDLAKPFVDRSHMRLAYELLLADNHEPLDSRAVLTEVVTSVNDILNEAGASGTVTDAAVRDLESRVSQILQNRRRRRWNQNRFDGLYKAAHDYVRVKFGEDLVKDATRHRAANFFGPRDEIWVYLDGKTRYLDELSEIVSGMPERIWRGRIYAPDSVRAETKSFCEKWLQQNLHGGGDSHV